MSALTQTAAQKTFFGKLLATVGAFLSHLLSGAQTAFKKLSPDQQKALINGVNVSQIIKDSYAQGEAAVVSLIAQKTGLTADAVTQLILVIAKDAGINVTSVQGYLDAIAAKVQAGLTDLGHNSLFSDTASFAASYLSSGKLDWVSLSLGLVEFAYQHFIKSSK